MSPRSTTLFTLLFIPLSILLLLYSYTQIDLGFNLPNIPVLTMIQKFMQQIGFFNRPLSTAIYLMLLTALFAYYAYFLHLARKKLLPLKTFWVVLILSSLVLTASYNAFSYDLFNYIFDAKILAHYGLNPYSYRALDFPNDPMLGFMHWTHRTYPYGPVWLLLTAPLYFLGFSNFLPIQLFFKLLIALSFLGSVYFIGEILKRIRPQQALYGMVLFAFNPLVLIECLVSSHNDITMLFFALASIYYLILGKNFSSILFLLFSIGTKFATIFILPVYLYRWYLEKKKKSLSWERFFMLCVMFMAFAMLLVSLRTTFQPWYLLYLLPFTPFLSQRFVIPIFVLSIAGLLQYVPFLYLGNWDAPVPTILLALNVIAFSLAALIVILNWHLREKKQGYSV